MILLSCCMDVVKQIPKGDSGSLGKIGIWCRIPQTLSPQYMVNSQLTSKTKVQ